MHASHLQLCNALLFIDSMYRKVWIRLLKTFPSGRSRLTLENRVIAHPQQ